MKIFVIDTGLSAAFRTTRNSIRRLSIVREGETVVQTADGFDTDGHGTAVVRIIDRLVQGCEITSVKVSEKNFDQWLLDALRHILANERPDVINLSCGVTRSQTIPALKDVCQQLQKKGVLLVAAFCNDGTMTYPASFPSVIGVDVSDRYHKIGSYEYVDDTVNIRTAAASWRLPALDSQSMKTYSGNSFSTPVFTAKIVKLLQSGIPADKIRDTLKAQADHRASVECAAEEPAKRPAIKRAVVFPFNKEVHALARCEDMLDFQIAAFCDLPASGRVGVPVRELIGSDSEQVIRDFNQVDWTDEFDTVVLSHLQTLSALVKDDLFEKIKAKCLAHRKNIYLFDEEVFLPEARFAEIERAFREAGLWVQRPEKPAALHTEWGGKVYDLSAPVLCVAGTASSQGKFTVQCALRKALRQAGYKVYNLGTEPVSALLGFEGMYTTGYGAYMPYEGWKNVLACNAVFHTLDEESPEILITGLQSRVIPERVADFCSYPIKQQEFILACAPDAYVLCVNPSDSLNHIRRSIRYLEGLFPSKVIAICVNSVDPSVKGFKKAGLWAKMTLSFRKRVCFLTDVHMPNILAKTSIKYFSK